MAAVVSPVHPASSARALGPAKKGWLPEYKDRELPARFADLKAHIISSAQIDNVVKAWGEVTTELAALTDRFNTSAQQNIPSVEFSDLKTLGTGQLDFIRRSGCVVIRNVVDDAKAREWKQLLQDYVDSNPQVEGFPLEDKQFFEIYWSRSQLEARAHPNVLAVSTFLNEFFHVPPSTSAASGPAPLVSLSTPLVYADRFRIRKANPNAAWTVHSPHIDGGAIEKWEDEGFREGCYRPILDGKWRDHDAYDMRGRLIANTNIYGRPNQSSAFRTWQGWLALSNTGPGEGTLRLFPDILLSNAYLLLRPFFTAVTPLAEFQSRFGAGKEEEAMAAFLAASNWRFDVSSPDFPGIKSLEGGRKFTGQRLDRESHPHLRLDREGTMISVPRVNPGDMVYWHCDGIHSVETWHNGKEDSSVIYIPAVPLTFPNAEYVLRQRSQFLSGDPAPDFPQNNSHGGESGFVKKGLLEHIGNDPVALRSMGLGSVPYPVDDTVPADQSAMRELANQLLYPEYAGAQK